MDGVQRAGAEHLTAARKGIACDGKRGDQRGEDAGSGETTQPSFLHSLLG